VNSINESSQKVLLVDDEPNVLAGFHRQLIRKYEVETAGSGKKALQLLEGEGPFAVVVSDNMMPGMNGTEFLAQVRDMHPDTVRIMLTGHADLDTAVEAVNLGYIFRFLTKPCSPKVLAQAVGAGIEQYKLIHAEREMHTLEKFKEAMDGIIMAFSTIVEARDPYTAGHQRRVARLSVEIAKVMQLDEDQIATIHLSAMLHDIGKIYVPADFLSKPGKLSEAEFSVIWAHPQIGRDILKSVDFVWPISSIVWKHHERLDGGGYPQGLQGDEIDLEARIISVADVVEAMASHRPYRASLGMERALNEVEANRGTRFDPDAVDTCLKLIREDGFELFPPGEEVLGPSPRT